MNPARFNLPMALLLLGGLATGVAGPAVADEKPHITLVQVQRMFVEMRYQTKMDPDEPLVWAYFFTDADAKKLEQVGEALTKQGYSAVNVHPGKDAGKFVLRAEKLEQQTPESLDKRNQELYALAEKYQIESYDGMGAKQAPK